MTRRSRPRLLSVRPAAWVLAGALLAAPALADGVAGLSDEFSDAGTLDSWQVETVVDGWPDQTNSIAIDEVAGTLTIEPETSGWFEDYRGVLRYKLVTGDFRVETRIRVTGLATAVPTRAFSLAGVMVRAPRHETAPEDWMPGQENWLFITAGTANSPGTAQIETKDTIDSDSELWVHPSVADWVELRIERRGLRFELSRRLPGGDWETIRTIDRDSFPDTVQVGVLAYSDWPTVSTFPNAEAFNEVLVPSPPGHRDLRAEYDYIRFSDPGCWDADLDDDGAVTLADLAVVLSNFGVPSGASAADGDLDGDGDVDLADLARVLAQFGESCAA